MTNRIKKRKLTKEDEQDVTEYLTINGQKNGNGMSLEKFLSSIPVHIKYKTPNQKKLVNLIKNNEITICSGLAGTGKTFLSCAVALELLKEGTYKKIVIVKSVTTLKDEEIGYLKGTLKEKMEPFMYSFYHNFEKIIGKYNLDYLKTNGLIEELPIAYMRGINIDDSIAIIDEAQNITRDNIRTIMTRLGENSKMIFLGDENQVDIKNKQNSSLNFIIKHFKDLEGIGTIFMGEDDVVRNPLIKKIEQIFSEHINT